MGSNFVLHDEELHPNVQPFEVERPLTGLKQEKQRHQRLHRPTVDVFAGEDKVPAVSSKAPRTFTTTVLMLSY
jgi:hypothetical protein